MRSLALVFPRRRYPSGDLPLGVATLAAQVRRALGWRVTICDTTFDPRPDAVERFLDRQRPDVVGVGLATVMLDDGLAACRAAHRRGLPVIVGGPHATVAPESLIEHPFIDAVVVGEGERSTVELLRGWAAGRREPVDGAWVRLDDGRVAAPAGPARVGGLDALPLPAWELLPMQRYLGAWGQLDAVRPGLRGINVSASRGCPFDCAFCQPVLRALFGERLRQRSPAHVVDEIAAARARYDIDGYWFTDDTFTLDTDWVEAFCALARRRLPGLVWGCTTRAPLASPALLDAMRDAGLRRLGIGLESACERIREGIYTKGVTLEGVERTLADARARGIRTLLFVMLGAPTETRDEVRETIRVAAALPADELSVSLFVPIPGTRLHRQLVEQGYALSDDAADYDYYARQPFRGELSTAELRQWQRYAYARFHAHPSRLAAVARGALHPRGVASLARKLRRLLPA